MIQYQLIRSSRKTIGMQVKPDGTVVVRAPYLAPKWDIDRFVLAHEDWVRKQLAKQAKARAAVGDPKVMTAEQFNRLKKLAKQYIPGRIEHFARLAGVSHKVKSVSIRCQKTRWGSCTAKGDISMNCLLMLAPKEVLDSVAAHEVCHLLEMNHSSRFYAHVLRIYPEYKKHNAWLKKNGPALQAMVPGRK